ncbi:SMI1/KNR4 family protein [Vibrio fluvialis]|uniref:SMI1/KNR4 family protein n=1 Tax=Vibrio fluvialis TaxID=676 RepID=UPI001558E268|nr:SMI1/KNR4 family protein [Vibrio fluvialis]EKO3450436.1 SMI1/KNR4 family protein [Vibrio fluvialis]EKO3459522.1 SMI1/KNR4 family protein [Vibrio fluvialis]EMA2480055.1 SMI1/KNR4 family protein [Vibrio fluvialis]
MTIKKTISSNLNMILSYLESWGAPVCGFLNKPINACEIQKHFEKINLLPTDELLELYQWKNGTKVVKGTLLDDVQLIPGFHLLNLQDSLRYYLSLKEDRRWDSSWFPIFANGGGDFYAVDLSKSDGKKAPIIGFILGELEQEIEYQSLTAMVLTYCECFRNNIVYITEDGYLEMDDEKHADLALKYNPDVEFWRS